METKGRKRISDEPLDGYNVRLTPTQARKARRLGSGVMAEGVRKALDDAEWPPSAVPVVPIESLITRGKERK